MNRTKLSQYSGIFLMGVAALLGSGKPADAASQQTFLSSTGKDTNPCTQAAPCRTFTAAIAAVSPKGEVIALDTAGYGSVTVTKGVSIIAPEGIHAGISATGGLGIVVSAGSTEDVMLQGVYINGQDVGDYGIFFSSGRSLSVERCTILGFRTRGIDFSVPGDLYVSDTTIRNIHTTSDTPGYAIFAGTQNSTLRARVVVDRCQIQNNDEGIFTGTNAKVVLRDTVLSDNGFAVDTGDISDQTTSEVILIRCHVFDNTTGLVSYSGGIIRAGRSNISNNSTGLSLSGGQILTQKNNLVEGNTTNGSFTADPLGTLAQK